MNFSTHRRGKRIKRILGSQAHRWAFCPDRMYYITPIYISQKIAQEICQLYSQNSRVWDMFGGIGTDAIHLAPFFEQILISEIDPETFQCLTKNLQTFNKKNVTPLQIDCAELLSDQSISKLNHIDLVYFDPPWGNTYVANQPFDFTPVRLDNGVKIVDLFKQILDKVTGNIVIKSPIKCQTFENLLTGRVIKVINYPDSKLKFILAKGNIESAQES